MMRAFWLLYLAAVAIWTALIGGLSAGPALEARLAPIRADQRIADIVRGADRVCWRWSSVKLRPAISDNIDAFVITAGDRSVAAPFLEATGMPWRRSGNVEPGPQSERFCALLPPSVQPADPVIVEQTIIYHGWRDLWTTRVRIPDVEVAGAGR